MDSDTSFPGGVLGLSADQLDETLPTPLYHQIYLVLRERIRSGEIAAGETLPGEQELARALKVSRITVKRALNELAGDRLVSRHRGRGTIVAGGATIPMVRSSFDNLIDSLKIMGLETEVELLEARDIPAEPFIADHLAIKPGDPVQYAVRLRKLRGEPPISPPVTAARSWPRPRCSPFCSAPTPRWWRPNNGSGRLRPNRRSPRPCRSIRDRPCSRSSG
jgi:DNA-binding transcriptional regulator YhcF (GntR family)